MARVRAHRQRAAKEAVQREDRRARHQARRRLRRWLYLAISAVIGLLVIVSLFLPSGGRNRQNSFTRNGGPGETFALLPANHIADNTTYAEYNSTPPTSGPHWENPAPWGVYTNPVPNERQVHNLEHGGVHIQYNTSDAQVISQLEKFAEKQPAYPCYLLVAPYPNLPSTIALTAWGVRDIMDAYDEARLQAFVEAYRNNGPERVPCVP